MVRSAENVAIVVGMISSETYQLYFVCQQGQWICASSNCVTLFVLMMWEERIVFRRTWIYVLVILRHVFIATCRWWYAIKCIVCGCSVICGQLELHAWKWLKANHVSWN